MKNLRLGRVKKIYLKNPTRLLIAVAGFAKPGFLFTAVWLRRPFGQARGQALRGSGEN